MNTRQIQTTGEQSACDVCGRTLLRGERAETYLQGGSRRSVCELCTTRALHEGWVREGTIPDLGASDGSADGRRSLLARLRGRTEPITTPRRRSPPSAERAAGAGRRAPAAELPGEPVREPRHVRAVPTSLEHRVAAAIEAFNTSEHCRTIAGVARSLGSPAVSVHASLDRPSVVDVTVLWELCWYRYEVELSDDVPSVRVSGQGYELDDLSASERQPNAEADERGLIALE